MLCNKAYKSMGQQEFQGNNCILKSQPRCLNMAAMKTYAKITTQTQKNVFNVNCLVKIS